MESNLPMTEPGVIGSIWSIWQVQRTATRPRRLNDDGSWMDRKGESRVRFSIIHSRHRPMEKRDCG